MWWAVVLIIDGELFLLLASFSPSVKTCGFASPLVRGGQGGFAASVGASASQRCPRTSAPASGGGKGGFAAAKVKILHKLLPF